MIPLSCQHFRAQLERALLGRPDPDAIVHLAWQSHLGECASCRSLLEGEEALEVLLASLPQPALPPELAQRVLARLDEGHRADSLDALLELDHEEPSVTPGLPGRTLSGLTPERREARLDALLDLDADAPVPPRLEDQQELGERVLAGLQLERADARLDGLLELDEVQLPPDLARRVLRALQPWRGARTRFALLRGRRPMLAAAAALVAVLLVGWTLRALGVGGERAGEDVAQGPSADAPSEELLLMLDVLTEDWELLMDRQLELDAALGSLSAEDSIWLEAAVAVEEEDR